MPTPSVPEDESAQLLTRHRHGRRRKKKRSKRFKNIVTVVVLFIMVLVIVWFLIRAIMDLSGASSGG